MIAHLSNLMQLVTAVKRDYLKARARKNCWMEEVELLKEEMKRVLQFLEWRSSWWKSRRTEWDGLDNEVVNGLKAYALRQAALHESLASAFQDKWEAPAVKAAREAADVDMGITDLVD
jgi:hypothetical protein